uniref:Uncharacterized protein n=1 Tax=Glossina pallidipes TaxID=7398 RepID=A0A1A9Z127_GLOPL
MAAIILNIQKEDEIIMPSYTFVSTANAFALRGAKIIFIDIRPDTLNINENLIESAITKKTKAIVVIHYGGSIGHIGCLSFHSTKNLTSGGEGGAILINDESLIERAEIVREKGTNRASLIKGINVTQHYVPLHLSPAGIKFGKFFGVDTHTSYTSENLVRLPLFFNLNKEDQQNIIYNVHKFVDTYHSVGRALDCDSSRRGFESHQSPKNILRYI